MEHADEDRLTEEWHNLARDVEAGLEVESSQALVLLDAVAQKFLPSLQRSQNREDVMALVVSTRQLERSWNIQLGKALIQADEALKRDGLTKALAVLDRFIGQCQWIPFVQIAQQQREHYCDGPS